MANAVFQNNMDTKTWIKRFLALDYQHLFSTSNVPSLVLVDGHILASVRT